MKSILDRSFSYAKSTDTDLRKTFARVRREQRQQAQGQHDSEGPQRIPLTGQQRHVPVS
jgi:hypothetical protein